MAAACPFSSHVTARDVLRFLTNFVSVAWAAVRRPTAVLLCRVKVQCTPTSATNGTTLTCPRSPREGLNTSERGEPHAPRRQVEIH